MKSEIKNIVYIDGKFYMKVNVVMLPTNKKAHFGDIILTPTSPKTLFIFQHQNCTEVAQHLYITSDEEINEGDWCYNSKRKSIELGKYMIGTNEFIFCKKIIATTDTSLKVIKLSNLGENWKDISLPKPSQEFIQYFIEEYNKGNIITDVLVEYEEVYQPYFENKEFHRNATKYQLKINSKNTITIHKQKDSWSREEAIELCKKAFIAGGNFEIKPFTTDLHDVYCPDINEWIEENL